MEAKHLHIMNCEDFAKRISIAKERGDAEALEEGKSKLRETLKLIKSFDQETYGKYIDMVG